MAQTKGKAGYGGAREGAGRPARPAQHNAHDDPVEFLTEVMQGKLLASTMQLAAAKALVGVKRKRGKKEELQESAKAIGIGNRFRSAAPPKPNGAVN